MTDTLTAAKSLVKQTVGGNSNTWGAILNSTLDLADKALGQTLTKAITANVTLTATEAQNIGYVFTGALAGSVTVTFPTFYGPAIIRNKTTGGFAIVVGMASGTTVTVGDNTSALVFSDGTDFASTNSDAGNISTGTVPAARLPTSGISASAVTTGTLPGAQLPVPGSVNGGVSNPTGTSNTAATMMGLGGAWAVTPNSTGKILVMISGIISNSLGGNSALFVKYGTGGAPSNGVAATGASATSQVTYPAATGGTPFALQAVITGLTLGVPVWCDLAAFSSVNGATQLSNLNVSALEA